MAAEATRVNEIPYPLLVILVLLAIAAGLWVGGRANHELESSHKDKSGKSLGARARTAVTHGVVSLWKWNRQRQKKRAEDRPAKRD